MNSGAVIFDFIGNSLYSRVCRAKNEIILISPFVKRDVIEKLLDSVHPLSKVICITRWRPDEIAIGVSDLEIWTLLKHRENTTLKLISNLHTKYYRADNYCQIGSANLTAAALGWSKQPNQELMVEILFNAQLQLYEDNLINSAIQVTENLYQQMLKLTEEIKKNYELEIIGNPKHISSDNQSSLNKTGWFPMLRNPSCLYQVYSGCTDKISQDSIDMAYQELDSFRIPRGLPEALFNQYLASLLLQEPIIAFIDECLIKPQQFGAMKRKINKYYNDRNLIVNSQTIWQNLMRWLLYFLPDKYDIKVPKYTEVFYRKK